MSYSATFRKVEMSVVGVVGDVRQYSLSRAMPDWIPGAIYMPLRAGGAGGRANSGGDDPAGQSPPRYRRPRARDSKSGAKSGSECPRRSSPAVGEVVAGSIANFCATIRVFIDRKSTRLNSSHANISYAVF